MAALAKQVTFNGQDLVETTMLGLHSSQIELFGGMTVMVDIRRFASVPVIYRSFLEATIDLKALVRNPTFVRDRLLQYYLEGARLAEVAGALEGATEKTRAILADALEHMREKAKVLKKEGAKSHSAAARFELAEIPQHYVEYMTASLAAHTNQAALFDRHAARESTSPGISLVLYKDIPIDTFRPTIILAMCLALESAHEIHEKFKSGLGDEIDDLALRCERALGPRSSAASSPALSAG